MQYDTSYSEVKSERRFNKRPFITLAFWSFLILLFTAFPLMEYASQDWEHAVQVFKMTFTQSGEFISYIGDWFNMLMDSSIPSYYQGWHIYIPFSIAIVPVLLLLLCWILEMFRGMMDTGIMGQRKRGF